MKRKTTAILFILPVLLLLVTGGVLWYDSVVPPVTFETYEEMQKTLNLPPEEYEHLGMQGVYFNPTTGEARVYLAPDSILTETQVKNMVRSPECALEGIYISKYNHEETALAYLRIHAQIQRYAPHREEDSKPWMELWAGDTPERGLRVYICMEAKFPATEEQWELVRELTEPYGDLIQFVESLDDRENVLALPYYTELA